MKGNEKTQKRRTEFLKQIIQFIPVSAASLEKSRRSLTTIKNFLKEERD